MTKSTTLIQATPEEIVSRVAAANESIIRKVVSENKKPEPFITVKEAAEILGIGELLHQDLQPYDT